MAKKLSLTEFKEKLSLKYPNLEVIDSSYSKASKICEFRQGDKIFKAIPSHLLSGSVKFRGLDNWVNPLKKSQEDIIKAIEKATYLKTNKKVEVKIIKYISNKKAIFSFLNQEVEASPLSWEKFGIPIKYLGIKKTAVNKLTPSQVQNKINRGYKDVPARDYITLIAESYVDSKTKANFIDSEYGLFSAIPKDILAGSNHPKRSIKSRMDLHSLTLEQVQERLANGYKSKNEEQSIPRPYLKIKPETYVDTRTPCVFIDEEFGEFLATPNHIFFGQQHPNRNKGKSSYEDEIYKWLSELNLEVNKHHKVVSSQGKRREIDLFLPNQKVGIEFHGLYWHNEVNRKKGDHFERRKIYEEQGLFVFQILEDEWNFKKDIVKSLILNKLKLNKTKIMARKTEVKEVSPEESRLFLEQNHLMGPSKARSIGLYYKGELVSLFTYKFFNKKGMEVVRFCNKTNCSVIGGFSKLLKAALKTGKAKEVFSWVDLRYGTGESLLSTGFTKEKEILSFKWTDNFKTYNRLHCRANMDERKLPEKDYSEEMGLYKIFDAGQGLFKKSLN